ncbi:MAG: SAM-dependent methyltransferase, partial [Streptomycetales bacterium]
MRQWRPWGAAIEQALYGPGGFFRGPEGPGGHFRTSAHASDLFAGALLRLAREVDAALGHPARFDLVDVGAGHGELLRAMVRLAPPSLAYRLCLHGVELAGRPSDLPPAIGWSPALPDGVTGLLVANEWLDDVPFEVVQQAPGGPYVVLVDPATGEERPGRRPSAADRSWLDTWWPVSGAPAGDRAEVGRLRDAAWASAVGTLRAGIALAIDYGHLREDRASGAYAAGTLAGYRRGRAVPPVPDG